MRFVFRTSYAQDLNLVRHPGYAWSYGTLLAVAFAAPLLLGTLQTGVFYIGELTGVFGFAVAGLGLMLLTGFTGLVSLGHAAFLGIGAYAYAFYLDIGVPFLIAFPLGGLTAGLVGVLFAIPVLRMTGIYLAIATLAFLFIVEQIFAQWDSVTNGFDGKSFEPINLLGYSLDTEVKFYYFALVILILIILLMNNLLRSPTGRAMIAIRDSETSAQSMGINIALTKITSFGLSATIAGIGGILIAQKNIFISPDQFNILQSIALLLMIVVGGLGSIHGAVLGAAAILVLQQIIPVLRDDVFPAEWLTHMQGLENGIFGLLLMLFIIVEPLGLYGMWRKIKLFLDVFPLYRARTFRRQKAYLKTERMK